MGEIPNKQKQADNHEIDFYTDDDQPGKIAQIIDSISDVPEMFLEMIPSKDNQQVK